jgi:hypothetical protein
MFGKGGVGKVRLVGQQGKTDLFVLKGAAAVVEISRQCQAKRL